MKRKISLMLAALTVATFTTVISTAKNVQAAELKPTLASNMRGYNSYGHRTLKRGSKGDDVLELQKFLNHFNDWYPDCYCSCKEDGKYGSETETAVYRFQVYNNLNGQDGICGPETWEFILTLD